MSRTIAVPMSSLCGEVTFANGTSFVSITRPDHVSVGETILGWKVTKICEQRKLAYITKRC